MARRRSLSSSSKGWTKRNGRWVKTGGKRTSKRKSSRSRSRGRSTPHALSRDINRIHGEKGKFWYDPKINLFMRGVGEKFYGPNGFVILKGGKGSFELWALKGNKPSRKVGTFASLKQANIRASK
jgi:hypothetical protein